MKRLSPERKIIRDKHQAIVKMYQSGKWTTEYIASVYSMTPRSVQRIATKYGVIRSQADANRVAAPLKQYHHVPIELRVKRKSISKKLRYSIVSGHPFCSLCGATVKEGVRLEVDHIDENPSNNDLSNLQVLCGSCNLGKSHTHRFTA